MRGALGLLLLVACAPREATAPSPAPTVATLPAPTATQAPPAMLAPAGPAWQHADDGWIAGRLDAARAAEPALATALADPAAVRLQIVVTEATADAEAAGGWRLVGHGYRADAEYVYTASAIKLAASVGALAALTALQTAGVPATLDTPLRLCSPGKRACDQVADATNLDGGVITLRHELRKQHLVSDNQAFGRLLDVAGAAALRDRLRTWGLPAIRLLFPMDVHLPVAPPSRPVEFRLARGVHVLPERPAPTDLPVVSLPGTAIGVAHVLGGQRHDGPRDMSTRNYVGVVDLHRLLLAVVAPGTPGIPMLGLEPDLRAFLLDAMTQEPTASRNPRYDDPALDGARYRPSVAGVERVRPRSSLRIVSKAGRAYGFYTENAWIEDVSAGRAFALTAAIYADADGVVGDDLYLYDELARPVLAALGEILTRELLGTL